jgi:predicted alpha/beta-fold hydrolase
LFVVGFSLGGNIALKLAGEAADDPVPGLERVAAIAPPIDFLRSVEMLERPRNRLYELYYVNRLVTHVRRRQRLFPDGPRVNFPSPLTMRLFDELYTAPMHGFRDALDYYQRASSFPFLPKIKVKTLVLTAGDDPFVAVETFREAKWSGNVDLHITERGGHLGFLGRDGRGGIRWAERMVARWILAQ